MQDAKAFTDSQMHLRSRRHYLHTQVLLEQLLLLLL